MKNSEYKMLFIINKKHVVNLLLCRPSEQKKEESEKVIAPHEICCDSTYNW